MNRDIARVRRWIIVISILFAICLVLLSISLFAQGRDKLKITIEQHGIVFIAHWYAKAGDSIRVIELNNYVRRMTVEKTGWQRIVGDTLYWEKDGYLIARGTWFYIPSFVENHP
jgi:hypothetical protein